MTVNIGLVTSEALVLGCDSIATASRQVIDPFAGILAMDSNDSPLKDKDGNLTIPLKPELFQTVVVDVMPGVAKMFKVYDRNGTFVAATTAGMAALLKNEFVNVNAVVSAFAKHINKAYEQHYASSKVDRDYWGDLDFLVGGYGKHDDIPCLFRLNIKQDTIKESFSCGQHGVAWAGQSDSIERVIRGYDSVLRTSIEDRITAEFDKYRFRALPTQTWDGSRRV